MKLPMSALKDAPKPDNPKFPTSDMAHDMAANVAKRRKKKKKSKHTLNGVDLEL